MGRRQEGRDREENVVDCEATAEDISAKIKFVLEDVGFREKLKKRGHRLGNGQAAEKILGVLKNVNIDEKLMKKHIA